MDDVWQIYVIMGFIPVAIAGLVGLALRLYINIINKF